MSSCSIIYVEYRVNNNSPWELLKLYFPIKDELKYDKKDLIELGGVKLFVSNSIVKCGIVRDVLNDPSKKFNNRGFPDDLSLELKEILDKQQEVIEEVNKSNGYDLNHDWRYGKSWCSLFELIDNIDNSYHKCLQFLMETKFSEELTSIKYQLRQINLKLSPQENMKQDKEYSDIDADVDYCNDLDDLIYAKSFCDYLYSITAVTNQGILEDNIRIVYYTE